MAPEQLDEVARRQAERRGQRGGEAQHPMPAAHAFIRIALVGPHPHRPARPPQLGAAPACRLLVNVPVRGQDHAVPVTCPVRRDPARRDVLPDTVGIARERIAEPAASRRLHDDHVPGDERKARRLAGSGKLELAAVADQRDLHRRRRAGAADAEGRDRGPVAQDRVAALAFEEPQLPAHPESAPHPALAAGIGAKLAPLDAQGHPALERLRRLDGPDIPEVDVPVRARAVVLAEAAVPTGRGFVVHVLALPARIIAPDGVRERRPAQVAGDEIGHDLRQRRQRHRHGALAHFPVGPRGGVAPHVHDGGLRRQEPDRPEHPVVDRPFRIERGLDRHEDARPGGREARVDDARHLGVRAREVGDDLVAPHGEGQPHEHRIEPAFLVELEIVLVHVLAVRERGDLLAQPPLRPVEVQRDAVEHRLPTVPGQQRADPSFGHPACPQRRVEVARAVLGQAHVAEQERHGGPVEPALLVDLDGRDADAFLVDVGGEAGIAPRGHPADVGPVSAHGGEDEQLALLEDGVEHGHVVQMGAAPVRVVQEDDVAGPDVTGEVLHGAADGPRHGQHVPGMILGLGDHLGLRIEERAREVVELPDHRGVRGADHGRPHLAHDGDEAFADHLERDRVDGSNGHVIARHPHPGPLPLRGRGSCCNSLSPAEGERAG